MRSAITNYALSASMVSGGLLSGLMTDSLAVGLVVGFGIGFIAGSLNVMRSIRSQSFRLSIAATDMIGGAMVGTVVYVFTQDAFSAKVAAAVTFMCSLLVFDIIPVLKSKSTIDALVKRFIGKGDKDV